MIRSTTENILGARYAVSLDWSTVMDLLTRGMQRVMLRAFDICKLACVFPAELVRDEEGSKAFTLCHKPWTLGVLALFHQDLDDELLLEICNTEGILSLVYTDTRGGQALCCAPDLSRAISRIIVSVKTNATTRTGKD
ncbi:hypothetical protein GLAREA_12860 [Glarea lozoyensis ATCC 20868]|uniref:Uncharacterized protein n=1 Tax=Glarea lozoyensis (strain ATCC 20868 / MF5171) TaxID=1116229 RepID=S3CUQ4_GLAL2|nr:uncharacterized protein GLAREA_12860 [Glarea lozoyensis ATCC 20868]EPE30137.1 hypothetical protein GLAREA_12860 [Glarea lozoyensis ATCC 20868]